MVLHAYSFVGLFFLLNVLSLWEFYRLIKAGRLQPIRYWGMVCGIVVYGVMFGIAHLGWSGDYALLLFPLFFVTFLIKLFDPRDPDRAFDGVAYTLLGIFYVTVPFALLQFIAFDAEGTYHFQPVLGIILLLWANDTGAYFVGRTIGKHPLFPRVSPKKTWEGFFGGAALALLVTVGLCYWATDLQWWEWLLVWVVLVVPASLGDLVESLLKRGLMQKDSARTLPGHGGFLDRFDGLLLASPFLLLLWYLLGH